MDKKAILGLVLIFGIFVGYMYWTKDDRERELQYNDSIRREQLAQQKQYADSLSALQALRDSLQANSNGATTLNQVRNTQMGAFNKAAQGTPDTLCISTPLMQVTFSTQGGQVQQVVLQDFLTYDSLPLELITPSNNNLNLVFSTKGKTVNTSNLVFTPYLRSSADNTEEGVTRLSEGDSAVLSLRAEVDSNSYLEFAYTLRSDSYQMGFDINFVGLDTIVDNASVLDLEWHNRMNRQEKVNESSRGKGNRNGDRERFYSNIYYRPLNDDVEKLKMGRDDRGGIQTKMEWVAFKQQYFTAILASEGEAFSTANFGINTETTSPDRRYLTDMSTVVRIPYDASNPSMQMSFYYGPAKYRDLRAMHRHYEQIIQPLGWWIFSRSISRWLIIPTFNFLEKFNWNYGIIIILFTLLFRLILLPLVYKSYQGSAIMRILKPEMDALNAKYPKPEDAMKKQQQMMALQKSAGYSPMAGCLPMLIQMPILTAMFMFFPIAIELRQKSFLWCDDLSTYDSILDLGFNIPLYGDHISLFCLLMFGMQFFYTWYTMRGQNMNAGMPGMKFMMYFMPFMMLFIFNSQSAGLNLYYFISLCFTMTTMILIRRFTSEKKVRARMAAYAQKQGKGVSKKKSNFQRKLEEMQKMAEQMQKQQQKR